jgi:hypothetical protein
MSGIRIIDSFSFIPPDGEFVVLNYRLTGEFPGAPSHFPSIEEVEPNKLEITILIRVKSSNHFGANVVEMPMPRCQQRRPAVSLAHLVPDTSMPNLYQPRVKLSGP